MLSLFPSFFTFSLFAPLILRIAVGIFFFSLGYRHLTKEKEMLTNELTKRLGLFSKQFVFILGSVEILIGLFFIAGFLTQGVVIVGMLLTLKFLWFKKEYPTLAKHNKAFYILLLAILFSLLLTGAGIPAVDLPL